ncbi:MAG: 23S rRNA (adenine(2503)-C(2))-methyltransferase RlmN [Candidatus Omnitrophica bacterium]|nr:23S rRNA (adenine(2503)-C(2))-methyltransferase RlmN [Candidatus Omnitrophota bacterium]
MTPQQPSQDIKEFSLGELQAYFQSRHQPTFHAQQIFEWIYQKNVQGFEGMTNLSAKFKEELKKDFSFFWPVLEKKKVSKDGTIKFLFKVGQSEYIETVFIPTQKRGTICLSTQVGCKFGCTFCASGLNGFARHLSCAEILDQILFVKNFVRPQAVTHVVFMGVGEPFDNYDNVLKALYRINAKEGLHIGARRITVSTCGLIPEIKRFAKEEIQAELSVSLHASDDSLRSQLMPVNHKYPLEDLLNCCRWYARETNRQITFEYVLLKGLNDHLKDAQELARRLKGFLAKVNLIVYNRNDVSGFCPPSEEEIIAFEKELVQNGIPSTVRTSRGQDVDAACGQLRFLNEGIAYGTKHA